MKTILKVIAIILLVIVGLIAALFIKGATTPAVPKGYTETTETGGEIEKTYLKNGPFETTYFEKKTDEDFKKYEVWYPKELSNSDRTYPVLVVLNGTGVRASKYKEQFKHFASWGFITIGTEEEEAWDGVAAEASLSFLLAQNETQDSIFYQKLDLENIGAVGHSQGGAGVFNAITEHAHSSMYKTAVPLSPAHEELAKSLSWHYDLTKVDIPVLMLAGTEGDFEMSTVIPTEAMHTMYDKLNTPKVMARKIGYEHGEMLYSADGYVTAWLMWQLQGDENAAKAFTGERPELLTNPLYQEQQIDLTE
ncbi:MAG: hypothetical protein Q4F09_07035 [Erysipelotrichaceae bacterium]|nr:hypothetical protein [Erysipelotrichaceae bacterium]